MPSEFRTESLDDAQAHYLSHIEPNNYECMTGILQRGMTSQADFDTLVTSCGGRELVSDILSNDRPSPRWDPIRQLASQWHDEESWRRTDSLIDLTRSHQQQAWLVPRPSRTAVAAEPWLETDRLIAQAKALQDQALGIHTPVAASSLVEQSTEAPSPAKKSKRKRNQDVASHFWGSEDAGSTKVPDLVMLGRHCDSISRPDIRARVQVDELPKEEQIQPAEAKPIPQDVAETPDTEPLKVILSERVLRGQGKASHYFTPPSEQKSPSKRPPAGTVSCMPFPPLDAPTFGLIQSKVAHEPFWLLIVVTFLIKTKGVAAAPVFWAVKERFPTPADLANPDNAAELMGMIRHLGLVNNRLTMLQKHARKWLASPPKAGKLYRVRNYDTRDMLSYPGALDDKLDDAPKDGMLTPKKDDKDIDAQAWEIGHMTEGKYALDSWRIFCRDVLLGRAQGWNGEGAKPEFQPEWCRVRPADKELRAYLRWMWMREGFEWDPATGDRAVLRPEIMKAVNERRVEWDDTGALRIVEEPQVQEE